MDISTIIFLAIGLSMDAFAVSVCKGLAMSRATLGRCLAVGLWFGGFQGLMPFLGYILGVQFEKYINVAAPWVSFLVLGLIGADMIKEALFGEEEEETESLAIGEMFILAIATSIDALAVGITFACVPVAIVQANAGINTLVACGVIAMITFVISMFGVNIGHVFGAQYKSKAELLGGAILVILGVKMLLEHFLL